MINRLITAVLMGAIAAFPTGGLLFAFRKMLYVPFAQKKWKTEAKTVEATIIPGSARVHDDVTVQASYEYYVNGVRFVYRCREAGRDAPHEKTLYYFNNPQKVYEEGVLDKSGGGFAKMYILMLIICTIYFFFSNAKVSL